MYHHLLVPLDGSELADQVLPHVAALAASFGARVTLLSVTMRPEEIALAVTPNVQPVAAVSAVDAVEIADQVRDADAAHLGAVAHDLRARGIDVAEEIQEGSAAEVIVARARELGVDLIAMSTHGRGGLARVAFGSVADHVVRHAPCPVLVVRVLPA